MNHTEEYSDEWELSKENVRPRKQGRNVSSLSAALQPQDDQMMIIKQQKQVFESELRTYAGPDPLDTWDRYIRWTDEVYPKGGKVGKLRALLERCVTIFKDEEKYKNDHRYVDAWIKFANFCNDPAEMFAFMFDQSIGCEVSFLYDAWATVLEDTGNTKKADAIYQEGLRRNAQPAEFLIRKHQEFQARVARGLMRSEVMETEDDLLEEEQRTALGPLRTVGRRHQVGTARTGTAKKSSHGGVVKCDANKPKQTSGSGFQIYTDENAEIACNPQQTGEWETVPKTGTTNRENEQKPGVWTKARVPMKNAALLAANATPSFTVHVDDCVDQPMVTPQKGSVLDPQVLSARKPEKHVNPLAPMQQTAPAGGLEMRPMYNKGKIYRGLEEFSFEELRGARWLTKQKAKEDQDRKLAEERQKIEEEAIRLKQAREELVNYHRSIREQLQAEKEKMMEDLRKQMALQQEHLENQRLTQTQQAQCAVDQDIQQHLQRQLNISHTPDTQENSSERLTRQLTFDDMTSHGNTENVPPGLSAQLLASRDAWRKKEAHTDPSTSLNSSQRTPVFNTSVSSCHSSSGARPKSRGPTPDSNSFSHGRGSLVAPSPTVNTQEALKVVRGMFNASLDCEKQYGWPGEEPMGEVSGAPAAVIAPVGSQPFAIYDESEEQAVPMIAQQDPAVDKENTPPKDYRPAPRRHNLSGYLQPSKGLPVDPEGEQDIVMVETVKVMSGDDSPEDYIEHMPMTDMTLATVGSSESFASAACLASTPYFSMGKLPQLPNPPLSQIKAPQEHPDDRSPKTLQNTQQPSFDVSIAPPSKTSLSPIFEGSTEGSGEESRCHPSHLTSKHHVTTTELCPGTISDNHMHHEIDIADYVAPEPDEKTEALLSMSIMINPHDPFDQAEIDEVLSSLERPLEEYRNYYRINAPLPHMITSFVLLGTETYNISKCIGEGGFGSVYRGRLFDMDNLDDLCDMEGEEKALKVQKPACPWEFYICNQIKERLKEICDPMDVSDSLMTIDKGYFYDDGSCLISTLHTKGSLLSLVNYVRLQSTLRNDMEPLVMFMTIEMMHMLEKLHKCHIIHGDIKPDNFLIRDIPCLFGETTKEEVFGHSTQTLKLIDFGRSIDMTRYPPGTTFLAKNTTTGFQCIEMRTDMPWTYQTDLFGLIGTIHVLVFCDYMKVYQSQGVWYMTSNFQRKWNVGLWKSVFHRLLNIPSCDELPDLAAIRCELEDYFMANLVTKYNQVALHITTQLGEKVKN
ncbi:mitotic checkpoint serine/threonine-protein kinase BUB1-like [Haliotis rufescens]|uniref:mitotic checkpoint serine/threonine-protein kinase BUB1-like n=1 Tax=Haliotis rufescens TaxID=6454 RepID=UPI00201EBAB8|nr:mitotic checkpoint serine/threonine-protein kinase BUB1-like [Haliotis rufescens]